MNLHLFCVLQLVFLVWTFFIGKETCCKRKLGSKLVLVILDSKKYIPPNAIEATTFAKLVINEHACFRSWTETVLAIQKLNTQSRIAVPTLWSPAEKIVLSFEQPRRNRHSRASAFILRDLHKRTLVWTLFKRAHRNRSPNSLYLELQKIAQTLISNG